MKQLFKFLLLLLTSNFIACAEQDNKTIIAKIPEASGISFCQDSQTLIVANDEGSFYELSTQGEVLLEHKLGDYDLEGVVCEKDQLVFAVEKGALLVVNRKKLTSKIVKLKGQGYTLTKKKGKTLSG